jgi:hypothetical protein
MHPNPPGARVTPRFAKVKIAKVIKRPTGDLNDSEGDYEVVEDTPRTELQINDIWSGDLDDPATINLPPVGVPAFRIANQTATNPPHLEVVQPKLIPVAVPAPVSVTTTVSESSNTAAGSEFQAPTDPSGKPGLSVAQRAIRSSVIPQTPGARRIPSGSPRSCPSASTRSASI